MTAGTGRTPPACMNPIDAPLLMDYWLGALPPADAEGVEEHLMTCDECGDRLRDAIGLADALRTLSRSGSLRLVVSDRLVQHATETGQRVREYSVEAGGHVQCTVAADDDLLVARLAADLRGATRVDLALCDAQGHEQRRMMDIPVRGEAGQVIYQESMAFAKAAPSITLISRLLAVDADGTERLLGEYTFHHTRTIAGPAGWEVPASDA